MARQLTVEPAELFRASRDAWSWPSASEIIVRFCKMDDAQQHAISALKSLQVMLRKSSGTILDNRDAFTEARLSFTGGGVQIGNIRHPNAHIAALGLAQGLFFRIWNSAAYAKSPLLDAVSEGARFDIDELQDEDRWNAARLGAEQLWSESMGDDDPSVISSEIERERIRLESFHGPQWSEKMKISKWISIFKDAGEQISEDTLMRRINNDNTYRRNPESTKAGLSLDVGTLPIAVQRILRGE